MKKFLLILLIAIIILQVFAVQIVKAGSTYQASGNYSYIYAIYNSTYNYFTVNFIEDTHFNYNMPYLINVNVSLQLQDLTANKIYNVSFTPTQSVARYYYDSNIPHALIVHVNIDYVNSTTLTFLPRLVLEGTALQKGHTYVVTGSVNGSGTGFNGNSVDGNTYVVNNFVFNVQFTLPSTGTDTYIPLKIPANLTGQLTSYDCITNTALISFSSNFNITSFSVVFLDISAPPSTSNIISWSFDYKTWNLTIIFSNTINQSTTTHYLGVTASGTDPYTGQTVQASTTVTLDLSMCSGTPSVKAKQFKIVQPENGYNFASGTSSISFNIQYGGNIESDFGTGTTVTIGIVKGLTNVGSATLTTYSIINGITYWNTTINLSDYSDGTYNVMATLMKGNQLIASDQITFAIGQSGNPLIDFLKSLWLEFKDWFINTMQYLFVPTDTQLNTLLNDVQQLNIKNYIPVLDLSSSQSTKLTVYNNTFMGHKIDIEIDLNTVPSSIWNITKVVSDTIIALALLYLIIEVLTK